jgi:hypothetical protein
MDGVQRITPSSPMTSPFSHLSYSQAAVCVPALHVTLSHLQGFWGSAPMFWLFSFGFLGLALIAFTGLCAVHTALACSGLPSHDWWRQRWQRRSQAKLAAGMEPNKAAASMHPLKPSQVLANFMDFLQEGNGTRSMSLPKQCPGTCSQSFDAFCDNQFYSCC